MIRIRSGQGLRLAPRRVLQLALATLVTSSATAWAQADRPLDPALPAYRPATVVADPQASYLTPDGTVRIGGAEHVQVIVERFNTLFTKTHPDLRFVMEGKGTTSAVPLLTFGKTLFAPMGRAINPIEAVPYRKIVGRDVLEIRVARTADDTSAHLATSLAVYVHRTNPLSQISARQVARMLSIGNPEGDFSVWGQLGLTGAWAQRPIHPYGTPEYSGFGDYLQQQHLQGRALAPTQEQLPNTEAILQRIASDPAGIGIAAINQRHPDLRALPIVSEDGKILTSGTTAEVSDGSYPYGRWLYFYVRRLPDQPVDPLVKEYLRLVLSKEGQAVLAAQKDSEEGYVPLSPTDLAEELRKLQTD